MRQEEINKLLLDPSFRNWSLNSNSEDFEKWENFLNDDSELNLLAHEAKQLIIQIELSESKQGQKDLDSFDGLLTKSSSYHSHTRIKDQGSNAGPGKIEFSFLVKIAAVLSFILVFSILVYFTAEKNVDPPEEIIVEVIKKQTQNGQQLSVTLPDGSRVKLNSNSSISYKADFFKHRKIELEGEAFFNVIKDETSPFVVKTEHFQTEVLGTSFNVNAYKDTNAKVSVTAGKVKVSSMIIPENNQVKILEKEQAVNINREGLSVTAFNMDEIMWKDGVLVFSDENIRSISSKIQRWFNVSIIINNEANIAGEFSGKYANESLKEILTGMGYALHFSFKMEGNEIIINGKN